MRLYCVFLFLGLISLPISAVAAELPKQTASYSADQSVDTKSVYFETRVYHDGGLVRLELGLLGEPQILILRPEQERIFSVHPKRNVTFEIPYDKESELLRPEIRVQDYSSEIVGKETMQGLEVTKFRTTDPTGIISYQWVTEDGIYVRMESGEGDERVVIQRSNIERGPQNSALFEPPAGLPIIKVDPKMLRQMTPGVQAH